ncbi:hypothetical protein Q4489_14325, partial [Thalassotalea sp. 1_MG-2023]|uniref:hypothetical protein n=1 Tax=Thalassotalea sp. 1_MG-2023 TaxID=3062680 RepID=UPI0026E31FAC
MFYYKFIKPSHLLFFCLLTMTALSFGASAEITATPNPSNDGNFTLSWEGDWNAQSYQVYETGPNNSKRQIGFNLGQRSLPLTGRAPGTWYYEVTYVISGAPVTRKETGSVTVVAAAPSIPSSLSVPSSDSDGGFTVSWGASSGTVTKYELYRNNSLVYSGMSRSR